MYDTNMNNDIVAKYFVTTGIDPKLSQFVEEIFRETGFQAENEIQRRFIYDPAKTWRVRLRGTFESHSAILQIRLN